MISRRTSFRIQSESSPKTDRLNQVPFGSSGIAANPLRPGSWQESCGTLRTFVVLTLFLMSAPIKAGFAKHLRMMGYDGYIFCFEPIRANCDAISRLAGEDP